ncbi:hypothetical protein [Hoylesella nanceiensis]|jgi:hypothetical protein|uniref:hypothetical protein n=1 Tax=Hoylesella nanceiensis TaxID=425941 RepID=UPI0028E783E3|nr:hypothetical protein [Hoylesella nanceiensis]
MKKFLFSIALLLTCTIQISAQSFDEDLLEGTWISNNDGREYDDYFGSIQKMVIGNYLAKGSNDADYYSGSITYKWTEKTREANADNYRFEIDDTEKILDFYITGNNRLHLIIGDQFSLRFKILELNNNTMKLQTKKGTMTFMKTTTGVQSLKVNTEISEKARYNINGQRLTRPEKGINIVQMSDNSARKEVVK